MDNGVSGVLYLKTPSGISKILIAIFSLCAFICAMIASEIFRWAASMGSYFNIISLLALIYAIVIIVLSVTNIASSFPMGHKMDLIICVLFSIMIFTSAGLYTPLAEYNAATTAAVIFQYLNGFTFLGNTLHKILQ